MGHMFGHLRIHLMLIAPLSLVGCGEEAGIQTYTSAKPASYAWPQAEARQASHEAGGVKWVWDVPTGWVDAPEVPDLLVADYRFPGKSEALPGRMTVSVIQGDAGGIQPNLQRWRSQLYAINAMGQSPEDSVSQPLPVPIGSATMVEFAGQYQGPHLPTRLAGAVVQVPAQDGGVFQTWFFKLVGDRETVNANRLAMVRLILSLRPEGTPATTLPGELFEQADPESPFGRPAPLKPVEDEGDAEQ